MRLTRALALGLLILGCDDGETAAASDAGADAAVSAFGVIEPPQTASAGAPLTVQLVGPAGLSGTLAVTAGGGSVPETFTIGDDGTVDIEWTLGVAPVKNRLKVTADGQELVVPVTAVRDMPMASEMFGDVVGYLDAEEISGSTEDLAFVNDRLLLGIPGGYIELDAQGEISQPPLTGDPITLSLGVAADADGTLWVADSRGHALHSITDGEVRARAISNGEVNLDAPNYVAVAPDGRIWFTDPCLGELLIFNPETEAIDVVHAFDRDTEGGPNGIAFSADGKTAYVATENVALLCMQTERELTEEIAGLFTIDVESPEAPHVAVAENVALFGDGLAFDAEGNLYVIFDKQEDFMLTESAVWVLPAGESELVRFLVAKPGQVYANVAFGTGDFGATSLYISLLHVPGFTDESLSRGVERVDIGIAGQPLF